jgi:hypothetical protein
MKRPQSMREVAEQALLAMDARRFWYDVLDFVDELRRLRDARMLSEEPTLLAARFAGGDVADAYLAAVAVELARELGAVPPAWTPCRSPGSRTTAQHCARPCWPRARPAFASAICSSAPTPCRAREGHRAR